MPGLMAEEEHRPQSSDTAAGDGKPDEAVLRDAPDMEVHGEVR